MEEGDVKKPVEDPAPITEVTDGDEITLQKNGDVLTLIVDDWSSTWDKISDDVETYSPICD